MQSRFERYTLGLYVEYYVNDSLTVTNCNTSRRKEPDKDDKSHDLPESTLYLSVALGVVYPDALRACIHGFSIVNASSYYCHMQPSYRF